MRSGRADPVELVERALARLAAVDRVLGAFVHIDAEGARRQAEARRRSEPDGPLHGVPVAVKDLFDVAVQVTTAGSRVPPPGPAVADAPAVARLRAAVTVPEEERTRQAQPDRDALRAWAAALFGEVDALLLPVATCLPACVEEPDVAAAA